MAKHTPAEIAKYIDNKLAKFPHKNEGPDKTMWTGTKIGNRWDIDWHRKNDKKAEWVAKRGIQSKSEAKAIFEQEFVENMPEYHRRQTWIELDTVLDAMGVEDRTGIYRALDVQ